MLKAAIVGAGNIGVFYDTPHSKEVLSHAHAYRLNRNVKLLGFYDARLGKSREASRRWGGSAFQSLRALLAEKPQIVSLCTPEETHASLLNEILDCRPRLILCEKPLGVLGNKRQALFKKAKRAGTAIAVNFLRRWEPETQKVQAAILNGTYGNSLAAVCTYNKGLKHIGTHAVDLAHFFFGAVKSVKALKTRIDWKASDPTIDAFLEFAHCPSFHLIGTDARKYSVFELTLYFEKAKILFTEAGQKIHFSYSRKDPVWHGISSLGPMRTVVTKLDVAMQKVINNCVSYVNGNESLRARAQDCFPAEDTCEALYRQSTREAK